MKFRRKPIAIEAVQLTWQNWSDVCELDGQNRIRGCYVASDGTPRDTPDEQDTIGAKIQTLEGEMFAREGDWIIKGIKGELYPCKPDIFAATYEAIERSAS
jgi:hypothetical protein